MSAVLLSLIRYWLKGFFLIAVNLIDLTVITVGNKAAISCPPFL